MSERLNGDKIKIAENTDKCIIDTNSNECIFFGKTFWVFLSLILGLEFISWISWSNLYLSKAFFVLILAIVLGLAIYKLEWGIYAVFLELFIGSKGYLLAWPFSSLSLRLGLFLVVFLAYIIWLVRERKIQFFHFKLWKHYLALIAIIFISCGIGYLRGNLLKNIFLDANGWLYLGLIFPLTQVSFKKISWHKIFSLLFAAGVGLIMKTLLLLFIFSQVNYFNELATAIYRWVRETGIGEITMMPNNFSRIFMQSQIYVLICFCISLPVLALQTFKRYKIFLLFALALLVIFLSYSRSFWVGTASVLLIFFSVALFYFKIKLKRIILIIALLIVISIADYGLALALINIPLAGNVGVSAGSLLTERTKDPTQEAAGSSRMNLIQPLIQKNLAHPIFGSGFGTEVTYETQDSRYLAMNHQSTYTTFSFEWGYLDLWLKLGLVGLLVYLLLLGKIFQAAYNKIKQQKHLFNKAFPFGLLLSFCVILVIHFFTPYLNHPLGLGWILLLSIYFDQNT